MKVKTIIPAIFITLLASCASLQDMFSTDLVVTPVSNVVEGAEYEQVPLEELPEAIRSTLQEGQEYAVVSKGDVKPGAPIVPLGVGTEMTPEEEEGIMKAIVGVAGSFFPPILAFEGILTLFSKRKRKHYATAIKKITPANGNVELVDAIKSVIAALGSMHSSKESEKAFDKGDNPETTE